MCGIHQIKDLSAFMSLWHYSSFLNLRSAAGPISLTVSDYFITCGRHQSRSSDAYWCLVRVMGSALGLPQPIRSWAKITFLCGPPNVLDPPPRRAWHISPHNYRSMYQTYHMSSTVKHKIKVICVITKPWYPLWYYIKPWLMYLWYS